MLLGVFTSPRECLQWEFSSLCGPPTGPGLASTERQQQRLSEATKQLDVLLMEQQDEEFGTGGCAPVSSDDDSQEGDQVRPSVLQALPAVHASQLQLLALDAASLCRPCVSALQNVII